MFVTSCSGLKVILYMYMYYPGFGYPLWFLLGTSSPAPHIPATGIEI